MKDYNKKQTTGVVSASRPETSDLGEEQKAEVVQKQTLLNPQRGKIVF